MTTPNVITIKTEYGKTITSYKHRKDVVINPDTGKPVSVIWLNDINTDEMWELDSSYNFSWFYQLGIIDGKVCKLMYEIVTNDADDENFIPLDQLDYTMPQRIEADDFYVVEQV